MNRVKRNKRDRQTLLTKYTECLTEAVLQSRISQAEKNLKIETHHVDTFQAQFVSKIVTRFLPVLECLLMEKITFNADITRNHHEHDITPPLNTLDQLKGLVGILEKLDQISRLHTKSLTIIPAPVNLEDIITNALELSQGYKEKEIYIDIKPAVIFPDILVDKDIMTECFHGIFRYMTSRMSSYHGMNMNIQGSESGYITVSLSSPAYCENPDSQHDHFTQPTLINVVDRTYTDTNIYSLWEAREILKLHGGNISISFMDQKKSQVDISLPVY